MQRCKKRNYKILHERERERERVGLIERVYKYLRCKATQIYSSISRFIMTEKFRDLTFRYDREIRRHKIRQTIVNIVEVFRRRYD